MAKTDYSDISKCLGSRVYYYKKKWLCFRQSIFFLSLFIPIMLIHYYISYSFFWIHICILFVLLMVCYVFQRRSKIYSVYDIISITIFAIAIIILSLYFTSVLALSQVFIAIILASCIPTECMTYSDHDHMHSHHWKKILYAKTSIGNSWYETVAERIKYQMHAGNYQCIEAGTLCGYFNDFDEVVSSGGEMSCTIRVKWDCGLEREYSEHEWENLQIFDLSPSGNLRTNCSICVGSSFVIVHSKC